MRAEIEMVEARLLKQSQERARAAEAGRDEAQRMAAALGFQLQGHMAAEDTSWCPEELKEPPQGWRETIAGWSKELAK
jgi:hypothetical protein